jgi:hypothetical protein
VWDGRQEEEHGAGQHLQRIRAGRHGRCTWYVNSRGVVVSRRRWRSRSPSVES